MLNIIDISGWQKGLDLPTMFAKNPSLGGVIVKATGGICVFQSDTFLPWATWLTENNKAWGFYHFLDDDQRDSSGRAEAEFFVSKCRDWFGKGIPILDFEARAKNLGLKYLKEALDTVYALTGVRPMLYCSQGLANQADMQSIAALYPLWVAQYPDYNPMYAFTDHPWQKGSVWPWTHESLRQYTSQMHLPGWRSNLDASLFYGNRSDWDRLAGIEPVFPPSATEKSIDDYAREVINGVYGNGKSRRSALEKIGGAAFADQVQARVNEILTVKPKKTEDGIIKAARDVIAGKYKNEPLRSPLLRLAGYDPKAVQAAVNRLLSGR